jgi:hypothetical protein
VDEEEGGVAILGGVAVVWKELEMGVRGAIL